MKKIMEVYGELVLGLIALVFLLILLGTFFTDGTVSGMVEESVDAILGNAAVYEEHMKEAAPEAVWTGEKLPTGREISLLSYMRIKTAASSDWVPAANVLTAGFSDFEVAVAGVRKTAEGASTIVYETGSGKCKFPAAGAYQINLVVTDKEKRVSSLSLRMIAE